MSKGHRRFRAQGLTEYIIIVAMIAIAAILVVKIFGKNLRMVFRGASESIKGGSVVAPEGMETYDDKNIGDYYSKTGEAAGAAPGGGGAK